jgi:hypothetical protein
MAAENRRKRGENGWGENSSGTPFAKKNPELEPML